MNKNFWIEGTDQNSNCSLTKNEISHKLRLALNRGVSKSMLEKETNETGRHSKIIIGPQSSDEEADDEEEQSAQVYLTAFASMYKTYRVHTFNHMLRSHKSPNVRFIGHGSCRMFM